MCEHKDKEILEYWPRRADKYVEWIGNFYPDGAEDLHRYEIPEEYGL